MSLAKQSTARSRKSGRLELFVNQPLSAFVGFYPIDSRQGGPATIWTQTATKQAQRPPQSTLAGQDRAIGPAAITAALLCTPRLRNVKAAARSK